MGNHLLWDTDGNEQSERDSEECLWGSLILCGLLDI